MTAMETIGSLASKLDPAALPKGSRGEADYLGGRAVTTVTTMVGSAVKLRHPGGIVHAPRRAWPFTASRTEAPISRSGRG